EIGIRSIAAQLGRSPSTVSREISRGRSRAGYLPELAHQRSLNWRHASRPFCRKISGELERYICARVGLDWSPEQISNRMKVEKEKMVISHTSIYRYIARDRDNKGDLWKHLRLLRKQNRNTRKKPEWTTNRIENRLFIDSRPDVVETRVRFGDFER